MSELPPRAEVLDALRFAVAPAAGAAGGMFLLAAAVLWRLTPHWRRAMPAVSVVSLAAGVASGNHFRGALPWVPDAAWWHWAGPAIVLVLVAEFVARLWGIPDTVGHLLRGLTAAVAAHFLTPPDWQAESRWTFPLFAAVLAVEWGLMVAVGRRHPGGTTSLAMAVVAGGAVGVLMHHHDLRFTDLATLFAVALATVGVLAWRLGVDGSAAAVAVVPVGGVLVLSRFLGESDVRWGCFLAVGLAPLLFVRPRWWAVGLVAVPVGWAVVTAMRDAPLRFEGLA